MNSELFFEGKKYVSSKRASKISRYNQDYIGQLIRDSKLEAKRVGRQWFVSLNSLEDLLSKTKGVSIKQTEKTQKEFSRDLESSEKPLFLEGKKFISSKEASALSGYSRDYIGQLVRDNRLEAKMVGRLWYVSSDSLEKHIVKQRPTAQKIVDKASPVLQNQKKDFVISKKYESEKSVPIPKLEKKAEEYKVEVISPLQKIKDEGVFREEIEYPVVKQKTYKSAVNLKRIIVAGLVAIVLVFSISAIRLQFSVSGRQGNESVASVVSASSFESLALDWYKYVNGKFIAVGKFFASIFGTSRLAYQTEPVPAQQKSPSQGIVVMPNSPENQQTVEHIKNSFSDQVGVSQNPDGVSGVIKPVFKKVSGDEYLYVLVPVKENKQ